MKTWQDADISISYINSVAENNNNEINITKRLYHDPFFFSLIPNLETKSILDIGCGNGYMLKTLREKCNDCVLTGTDLSSMIRSSKNKEKDLSIRFVPAVCHKLPFEDNSFDVVISSLMFHWVDHLKKICTEIYRVLKPGGNFISSNIHPNTFHVGKWINSNTKNPKYVLNKDISKPQQFEVYLNRTVGPLTYYMRPVRTYSRIFKETNFINLLSYEPLLNDGRILEKYPQLYKYNKYPLYLFLTGKK